MAFSCHRPQRPTSAARELLFQPALWSSVWVLTVVSKRLTDFRRHYSIRFCYDDDSTNGQLLGSILILPSFFLNSSFLLKWWNPAAHAGIRHSCSWAADWHRGAHVIWGTDWAEPISLFFKRNLETQRVRRMLEMEGPERAGQELVLCTTKQASGKA